MIRYNVYTNNVVDGSERLDVSKMKLTNVSGIIDGKIICTIYDIKKV